MATYKVEYLTDTSDPKSLCWNFVPLASDLEDALDLAGLGLPNVADKFGAKRFRILDALGAVLATEGFIVSCNRRSMRL